MRREAEIRPNDIIPWIWQAQVEKKNYLFLSAQTLKETCQLSLRAWLRINAFYMVECNTGAFIRPIINVADNV